MATIPNDLLRGDTRDGVGILSSLIGRVRLFFSEQRVTTAQQVNQADADFYDRFYG